MRLSDVDSAPNRVAVLLDQRAMDQRAISRSEAAAHTPMREICHGAIPVKKRNDPRTIALGTLALALFALAGCSARSVDLAAEPPRCELSANAICASAIENYLTAGAVRLAQAAPSKSPHLVPLVAPVSLPGGELAAEVDCYVNVDPGGSWLVYAHVAIPPESSQAIERLRSQELCTDELPGRKLAMESTLYNP